MTDRHYVGSELDLFGTAIEWKRYFADFPRPFLKGRVLEVGAGIGGTTSILCDGSQDAWVCLEPDRGMAAEIQRRIEEKELPACCRAVSGCIQQLPGESRFNAILYIDVLEHIEDDRRELEDAVHHLLPGGTLVVVAPAHQWLFSRFDKAIGHYRRYTGKTLESIAPSALDQVSIRYLDSFGLLLSLSNRLLLRQSMPTQRQIDFWCKVVVPISKRFDPLTNYSVGKSIVGIWRVKERKA